MRRTIVLAGLVVLVGCSLNEPITDPTQAAACGDQPGLPLISWAVDRYTHGFGFKDPGSVQTQNVRLDGPRKWNSIHGSLVGWQVSFDLNAKNGYGAYVGFQRREVLILADRSVRWRSIAPI